MDVLDFPNAKSASTYVRDVVERVLWTFLFTAGGVAAAAGPAHWMELSLWKTAVIAGIAAAGSLLKGIIAKYVRNPNSASTAKGV
jgi:hypothetical protein